MPNHVRDSEIMREEKFTNLEYMEDTSRSQSPPTSHDELTPEELVVEKKLRRKIDSLIMPLVVLVYLMNYIDR